MPFATRWYIEVNAYDNCASARNNVLDAFDYRAPVTGRSVAPEQIKHFITSIPRGRSRRR